MISRAIVHAALVALLLIAVSGVAGATTIVESDDQFRGQPDGINAEFVTLATIGNNRWTGSVCVNRIDCIFDRTDLIRVNLPPEAEFVSGSFANLGPRVISLSGSSVGFPTPGPGATTEFVASVLATINAQGSVVIGVFDFCPGGQCGSGPTGYEFQFVVQSVPEPHILALLALGFAGIRLRRCR